MKPSDGGRKRGRPRVKTPEQRSEKARLRQARHRRKIADEQFARLTNSARIIELEVLHWLDLLDYLVVMGMLDHRDVENAPAIEDAVADLLNYHLDECRAWQKAAAAGDDFYFRLPLDGPGPNFRPRRSGPGTVRFRVDFDDAEALEIDADDTRKLRERLEDILFKLYSAIEDWRRPDAYGIPWGNIGYGRGLEAFATKPRRTPAFGFEINAATQAYMGRGAGAANSPERCDCQSQSRHGPTRRLRR